MTPTPKDAVFQSLLDAWRGGPAADDEALSGALADAEEAYTLQMRLVAALDGPVPGARHWKSGGPSRETVLTHAPLPLHGVRADGADFSDLPLRRRGIEAEIALRLGREVPAREAAALSQGDALALVDAMCVSIEVVDSRWARGREAPALLKLADLQSHGALVLGDLQDFRPRDWAQQRCRVRIGTADWQQFQGSHSLGDPAWLLPAWLRHVTRDGRAVAAGTIVTTGTWCGLLNAAPGDRIEVEFPGIGRAACRV